MRDVLISIAALAWLGSIAGIIWPFFRGWRRKHFALSAVGLFILMMIIVPKPPVQEDTKSAGAPSVGARTPNGSERPNARREAAPPQDQQYYDQLEREVRSMRRQPRHTTVENSRESVMAGILLLGARAQLLKTAPEQMRPETRRLETEYRQLHQAFQRDLYPRLRRAQAAVWDEALWESDVDAATIGGRHERIRFTGGIFASNRNVAEGFRSAEETLRILRFTHARYEWYRGSDWQEYTLEAPSDGTLATLNDDGSWTPLRGRD